MQWGLLIQPGKDVFKAVSCFLASAAHASTAAMFGAAEFSSFHSATPRAIPRGAPAATHAVPLEWRADLFHQQRPRICCLLEGHQERWTFLTSTAYHLSDATHAKRNQPKGALADLIY